MVKKKINYKALYMLLSFLLSSGLMILILLFNRINGIDYLLIRSDFIDGLGSYKALSDAIFNHENIYFNYTTGLGLNNSLSLAGLFSPFTLPYLFVENSKYDLVTAVVLVLRVGLSSLAFQIFSYKVLKNSSLFSVVISVFYSLNSFVISYGTIQVPWVDCLIILPLLCYSIYECIENNKRVLLIIFYSYIFISSYYFGYMIGIFTLLFVVLYLLIMYNYKTESKIKEFFSKILNWALGVLISILISAFVWIPTLFFLASNRVPDSTTPEKMTVSILQIFNSLFWGMSYGIHGTYSYIYCGIPVLILAILFFANKRINIKNKLFYGILIGILAVSMISYRLNLIWHVFDQPDDFWYRYSFIFCFCLCILASIEASYFDTKDYKQIIIVISSLILFYQLMLYTSSLSELYLDQGVLNSSYGFMVNFILMLLWGILIYFSYSKDKYRFICFICAIIIAGFELISNSKRNIMYPTNAQAYNCWNDSVDETVEIIKNNDKSFYRTIITGSNTGYNSDSYFGINGIGDFGNQEKYNVRNFLSNIGFATSPRVTCENGYTPVSEMILGVKYEIKAPEILYRTKAVEVSEIVDGDTQKDNNINDLDCSSSYTVNPYSLSVGYLVEGETLLYNYSGRNIFDNMNEIVSTISGLEDKCFISIPVDNLSFDSSNISLAEMDTGEFVFSRLDTNGQMEISVPKNEYNKAYIQFEKDDPGIYGIDYIVVDSQNGPNVVVNRLGVSSAIEMTTDDSNDLFKTTIGSFGEYSPEIFGCDGINVVYLDEAALEKHYKELSQNQLEISRFENGYIEGTIHVSGNKHMLFTTIPYDPGWRIYINGIETEPIRLINGTFLALLLPSEGDFNIVLDYECPGLKIGIIVSICGLLGFLSVIFEKKIKKNNIKSNRD